MATIKKVFKYHMLDGKFFPVRTQRWVEFMDRMATENNDEYFSLTVEKWSESRTKLQNNAFHGPVLQQLCDFTGYSPKRMKEILIHEFAPVDAFVDMNGEVIERRKRTSEMNIQEFVDFLNQIIEWAAMELGLTIDIDPDLRTSGLKPRIPDHEQPQWTT